MPGCSLGVAIVQVAIGFMIRLLRQTTIESVRPNRVKLSLPLDYGAHLPQTHDSPVT
jgi:hypothetical protein